MFSVMQLTQNAHGLVLSYRLWTGLCFLALAVILIVTIAFRRAPVKRRWSIFAAILVSGWSGIYFTTFKATMTPHSASVYAFMRSDQVVSWPDATDVYVEQNAGDAHVVLIDRQRRSLDVNVADLSRADRERLVTYMLARIAGSTTQRTPALLERQAPARSMHLFSDQQI